MGDVKRYTMDANSLMGGMDMFEDDNGEYVLHSDYAILESKFKTACAQNKALLEQRNSILARHNALFGAVENERRLETAQDDFDAPDDHFDAMIAARAEVERLIAEGHAE